MPLGRRNPRICTKSSVSGSSGISRVREQRRGSARARRASRARPGSRSPPAPKGRRQGRACPASGASGGTRCRRPSPTRRRAGRFVLQLGTHVEEGRALRRAQPLVAVAGVDVGAERRRARAGAARRVRAVDDRQCAGSARGRADAARSLTRPLVHSTCEQKTTRVRGPGSSSANGTRTSRAPCAPRGNPRGSPSRRTPRRPSGSRRPARGAASGARCSAPCWRSARTRGCRRRHRRRRRAATVRRRSARRSAVRAPGTRRAGARARAETTGTSRKPAAGRRRRNRGSGTPRRDRGGRGPS